MKKALAFKTDLIRKLNDEFRTTFQGGRVMMTPGVLSLTEETRCEIIQRTMSFTDFNDANDPHEEHDFIAFEYAGAHVFAKIDYYSMDMDSGSDDPTDPAKTNRVLTIMTADEY